MTLARLLLLVSIVLNLHLTTVLSAGAVPKPERDRVGEERRERLSLEPFDVLEIGGGSRLSFYAMPGNGRAPVQIGVGVYVPAGGSHPYSIPELRDANAFELHYAFAPTGDRGPVEFAAEPHNRYGERDQGWALGKAGPLVAKPADFTLHPTCAASQPIFDSLLNMHHTQSFHSFGPSATGPDSTWLEVSPGAWQGQVGGDYWNYQEMTTGIWFVTQLCARDAGHSPGAGVQPTLLALLFNPNSVDYTEIAINDWPELTSVGDYAGFLIAPTITPEFYYVFSYENARFNDKLHAGATFS